MMNANETKRGRCLKCDGTGLTTHRHIEGGVCFPCNGTGVVELRPRHVRPWGFDLAQHMRNLYKNARLPPEDHMHLSYEAFLDPRDGSGWTHAGLVDALDSVPGSREAFRKLGWPV